MRSAGAAHLMALVVERLTDGMAVLLLVAINLPLLLQWKVPLALSISIGAVVVIACWLVLCSPWTRAQLKSGAKRLIPAGWPVLLAMVLALRQLLQPGLLLQATLIGAVAWSLR